ncbi:MAG: Hsp20/alpha crystallin family protein [Cyclobacteriaceae bacterium]|nr:Hsp20/alpha crystallin family protein [Cyclobacteriaceae bacterium]
MNKLVRRSGLLPTTSFFDDFLTKDLFDWSGWTENSSTVPRVNIVESGDDFRVEVAAPGMRKDDFHISLDNDMLTISSEIQNEESKEEQNYLRREFSYQAFKRSFYLPNTVEADKIKATYKDGLLQLAIPKKEEAKKKPVKTIAIS